MVEERRKIIVEQSFQYIFWAGCFLRITYEAWSIKTGNTKESVPKELPRECDT